MKIETQPREDHQVTVTLEAEPEQMETARRRAARKISERANIPGFRPGKAPYDIVRRMLGEKAIDEEAVQLLVEEVYPLMIKEAGIEPAGQGELQEIESLDPPKLVFIVPLAPTVDLGDYKSVRLAYQLDSSNDDKVEERIAELRRMYGKTDEVERAIQDGDYAQLDFTGVKAKPAEGEEDAPVFSQNDYALMVFAQPKDEEWPFPGFSKKLIGLSAGDEKEFSYKFPKDYGAESLQGQSVKFSVKVKSARQVILPDLNDDFAALSGIGSTMEEMREKMRADMETRSRNEYEAKYFEDVLTEIKAGATVKYPPQLLNHEMAHMIEDIEQRLKAQGVESMEVYYQMVNTTQEKFIEEQVKPMAQGRLERGLIMDEIARAENVKFNEQQLQQEFGVVFEEHLRESAEFRKLTKDGARPSRETVDAVAMESANRLLYHLTMDRVKAIANGEMVVDSADDTNVMVEDAKPARKKKAKAPAGDEPVAEPVAEVVAEAQAKPARKKAAKAAVSEEPAAEVEAEAEAKPAKKKAPAKKKSE